LSPPVLPGYRDFVLVARSGASEVYRAYQEGLQRPVAVKVLLLDDDEAIARFRRELEITVSLGREHPHIVTVVDTGTTEDGRPCIVMQYYDLGSLHDRLRARGPLPWAEVLQAGMIVADALSFAHSRGVLHRDVKPQNILLLPTSYVVADFGIARPIDAAHTSSLELFSVRHASPQVLDGIAPTVADDIWSVGSTLFTLLDGRAPFAADDGEEDSALAYMRRVRVGNRRRLDRPDVPPPLAAIIDRCLQRERSDRFPDAITLYESLSGWRRRPAPGHPGPIRRRNRPGGTSPSPVTRRPASRSRVPSHRRRWRSLFPPLWTPKPTRRTSTRIRDHHLRRAGPAGNRGGCSRSAWPRSWRWDWSASASPASRG
jgi:serine/threonine protein kinase